MATGVSTECATERIDALVTLDLVTILLGRAQFQCVPRAVLMEAYARYGNFIVVMINLLCFVYIVFVDATAID
jgi:hypothetical protein